MAKDIEALTGGDATDFATVVLNAMGLANDPATTTGLTYGYKAGRVQTSTGIQTVSAGTVALLDDATNKIYHDLIAEAVIALPDTTLVPTSAIHLATVETASGAITEIEDKRIFLNGTARFFQSAIADGGFASATGLDLTLAFGDASYLQYPNGSSTISGNMTVTLADDALNYIEHSRVDGVVANIVGFTAGNYKIGRATTVAGEVTSYDDRRPFASVPGPAFFQDIIKDGSFASATGLDLTVADEGSRFLASNGLNSIGTSTVTLTDDANNFVEVVPGTGAVIANTTGFTVGNLPLLMATTESGEVTVIDDRRAFASVPGVVSSSTMTDLANDPDTTTGLDYGYKAGVVADLSGSVKTSGAGTVAVPDDTDGIYVYFNPINEGVFAAVDEGSVPFGMFKMARLVTVAGAITAVEDKRAFANAFGNYSSQQLLNDLKVTQGAAPLDVDVAAAATVNTPTGTTEYAGGTITVTDDAISIIQITAAGSVISSATLLPGNLSLAAVGAESGAITLIEDRRGFLYVHGNPVDAIEFIIDGGGSAITTGVKGWLQVPCACTITAARLLAGPSGSMVVDIWKDTYANFPPTDADSITASAPPTISAAVKSEDTTLTGWTVDVAAGDILLFNVDSAATITLATLILSVTK